MNVPLYSDLVEYSEPIGVAGYIAACGVIYVNRKSTERRLLSHILSTPDRDHSVETKYQPKAKDPVEQSSNTDADESGGGRRTEVKGPKETSSLGARGKAGTRKKPKAIKSVGSRVAGRLQDLLMLLAKPLLLLLERRLNSYGKLSWQEVEYLLWREGNTDGSYIVSESIKHPTYYELAVCLRGKVHHYLVRHFKKDGGSFGIEDGLRYPDLYELVNHYHRESDGLCCQLARNSWRADGDELLEQMRNQENKNWGWDSENKQHSTATPTVADCKEAIRFFGSKAMPKYQ